MKHYKALLTAVDIGSGLDHGLGFEAKGTSPEDAIGNANSEALRYGIDVFSAFVQIFYRKKPNEPWKPKEAYRRIF